MYSIFEGLNETEIAGLLKRAREEKVTEGALLTAEGDDTEGLCVLAKGEVEVRKRIDETTEIVETIREGEFFGEFAPLDGRKNSVSVVAARDCTLILFDRNELAHIIEQYPQISWNIAKTLSRRLKDSDDALKNQIGTYRMASRKEIARLNSVVQATQTVNSSLDLDRVLELILQEAMRITDAERGTIYLIDESLGEIWGRVIAGDDVSEIRQPVGKGISGYVAQTGETVNVSKAYEDKRFNPEFDRISGYKTKSILCMPMKNRENKIIGVFQLLNKGHGATDFDREDESFLKAFSVNAAIAVENSNLAQRMVQTERLSVVGKMAEMIIHDIKSPMSIIRLYAQVLKKKEDDEESAELLDEIIRQIDRLVDMSQELLHFSSGVTQLNILRVSFVELLSGALHFLERDFEKKNIEIHTDIRYDGEIETDPDKMTRVLLNIGGNAGDAMPDGGVFTVRAYAGPEILTLELADTGIGMPEELKKKIFEPFVTYGKKGGTGLGMAIVKKILGELHGTIDIQSELGKGTNIILKLPLRKASEKNDL